MTTASAAAASPSPYETALGKTDPSQYKTLGFWNQVKGWWSYKLTGLWKSPDKKAEALFANMQSELTQADSLPGDKKTRTITEISERYGRALSAAVNSAFKKNQANKKSYINAFVAKAKEHVDEERKAAIEGIVTRILGTGGSGAGASGAGASRANVSTDKQEDTQLKKTPTGDSSAHNPAPAEAEGTPTPTDASGAGAGGAVSHVEEEQQQQGSSATAAASSGGPPPPPPMLISLSDYKNAINSPNPNYNAIKNALATGKKDKIKEGLRTWLNDRTAFSDESKAKQIAASIDLDLTTPSTSATTAKTATAGGTAGATSASAGPRKKSQPPADGGFAGNIAELAARARSGLRSVKPQGPPSPQAGSPSTTASIPALKPAEAQSFINAPAIRSNVQFTKADILGLWTEDQKAAMLKMAKEKTHSESIASGINSSRFKSDLISALIDDMKVPFARVLEIMDCLVVRLNSDETTRNSVIEKLASRLQKTEEPDAVAAKAYLEKFKNDRTQPQGAPITYGAFYTAILAKLPGTSGQQQQQ